MGAAWAKEIKGTGVTNTAFVADAYRAQAKHMLEPEVMKVPIVWIMSDLSDSVTGARFVAKEWDAKLPVNKAAKKSIEAPAYLVAANELSA